MWVGLKRSKTCWRNTWMAPYVCEFASIATTIWNFLQSTNSKKKYGNEKKLTLSGSFLFRKISSPSQNQSWLSPPWDSHKITSFSFDWDTSKTFLVSRAKMRKYLSPIAKGQLISKGLFAVFICTKNERKYFSISALKIYCSKIILSWVRAPLKEIFFSEIWS